MLCVLVAAGVYAQSHTYRDTSYVRYEQFDFDAWVREDSIHNGKVYCYPLYPSFSFPALLYDDILQYNYTDNPDGVRVVGLSGYVFLTRARINPNAVPEYLLLYDAKGDTFELKGQLQWFEDDTAGRPDAIFMVNQLGCQNSSGLSGIGYIDYVHNGYYDFKIFDLYFDKPITVYDSFYVGGTSRFMSCLYDPEIPSWRGSASSYIAFRTSQGYYDTACYFPSLWKMYHYQNGTGYPQYQWHWLPSNQFMMVLPIIEVVDTSFANVPACPRVSGLFTRGSYTDTVTVQWAQDSLHQEFELSYGREGTRPEDGTVVTVYDNRWQFTDAAYSDTPMVAYVRTVCREYDTLRWSGWSSPVYWRLHHNDTTHLEGTEVADEGGDLSRFVRLMPNPASGSVVVMSSYGIDCMEVYDVRGERVLEQKGKGRTMSAGFDVTTWAKGVYVVLVYTPAGTAAKRLVVE